MGDRRRSRAELRKGAPAFVDNANTGRRTGKFIPTVQLDDDGFESIEGLFGSQAYTVDAPKQRARKQQLPTLMENSYVEEEEMSMELTRVENNVDMDDYDIPEVQAAPAPVRRPVARGSSPVIDDHVPSPQRFSQSSQSTRRAKAPLNSARRSHSMMRSSSPVQPDPESEEDDPEPEPEPEPEKSRRQTLGRRSTLGNGDHSVDMELDEPTLSVVHEQEEDVEVVSPSPPPSPPKVVKKEKTNIPANKPSSSSGNKSSAATSGKKPSARTPTPPPPVEDDMEDDIANGLAQLDAGLEDEEDEPEPEPPAKPKKAKEDEKAAAKAKPKDKGKGKEKEKEKRPRDEEEDERGSPKKSRAGKGKENTRQTTVEPVGRRKKRDFNASTPPNVRRSQRERFSPLEWWRGEKFVYGRSPDPEEGPLLVPLIKAIERPPKPPTAPLTKKGAKKSGRRIRVKKEEEHEEVALGDGVFGAPRTQEDGMDEDTEELGVVMDYATGKEVERRIAFPGARVDFNPSDGPFSFQKIFGDSDFFAAGVMKIPVGGKKPNKPSKENTFVFYCVSGAVEVKIHRSTFTIAPGGMFLAPRGNVYTISNISHRDAYIFFAQSRKVVDDSDEPPPLPREKESLGAKGKAKVVPKK
ncbi:Mif2/CENP-C-like protein [Rhizoctonia solani 123E]|uniref:CENP-C homolog n=1 Tax=Rhizoctonia solani 123E TaxID=1423351 RepID=A0A074S8H9_9AGAM|nr:Mif2/CENP-C-like protein [Rhizoctonia solani 123E]